MKHFLWTVLSTGAVGGAMLLVGCGSSGTDNSTTNSTTTTAQSNTTTSTTTTTTSGSAPAGGKKLRVTVIPKGLAHSYWQGVKHGADQAAQELNVDVNWQGPSVESDVPRQVSIVETAITQGVDGIVLAPIDRKALVKVIDKAKAANIPLVIFDSDADTPNRVSFVATDNKKGGQLAAERIGQITGGKGTVLMVPVQPNSQSTGDRESGFQDAIKAKFPQLKVIVSSYGYSDRGKSMAAAENALTAHPEIVAVFGPNESSADGALQALKAHKLNGKTKLVGFDSATELIEGLHSGDIDSLVVQNPHKMGYEGVKAVVDAKAGKKVAPRIDTGVKLISKADMDTPDNKKLLNME